MRLFNSFQIVTMFVAWPFLVNWLHSASFSGAAVAFYAACALYVVMFGVAIAAMYEFIGKD